MGIEILSPRANRSALAFDAAWRTEYEDGSLTVLQRTLSPSESGTVASTAHQLFMLCTEGTVEVEEVGSSHREDTQRRLTRGDFLYLGAGSSIVARNAGSAASGLMVLAVTRDL